MPSSSSRSTCATPIAFENRADASCVRTADRVDPRSLHAVGCAHLEAAPHHPRTRQHRQLHSTQRALLKQDNTTLFESVSDFSSDATEVRSLCINHITHSARSRLCQAVIQDAKYKKLDQFNDLRHALVSSAWLAENSLLSMRRPSPSRSTRRPRSRWLASLAPTPSALSSVREPAQSQ